MFSSRNADLLKKIDSLIADHSETNPILVQKLQELRREAEIALSKRFWLDLSILGFKLAAILESFFDEH